MKGLNRWAVAGLVFGILGIGAGTLAWDGAARNAIMLHKDHWQCTKSTTYTLAEPDPKQNRVEVCLQWSKK